MFLMLSQFSLAIIVKTVSGIGNETSLTELTLSSEASGLVGQYKDIIREQDFKLQSLRDTLKQQHDEMKAIQIQLVEAQQSNSQLFDQNILLKAQLSAATNSQQHEPSTRDGSAASENHSISHSTQISFYESENARLVKEVSELNDKLNSVDESADVSKTNNATTKSDELLQLRRDQEDLLELLSDQVRVFHLCR